MRRDNSVVALVGAQHGSEGKGVIAARLARGMMFSAAVRVGGPNAGHSFYHDGRLYKMRSVPCAWVAPGTQLIIGAGAVVNPELLESELESLPIQTDLVIDRRAVLVGEAEEHAEIGIKASIGSTGEGVGAARIAKIRRDGKARLAGDYPWEGGRVEVVDDASAIIEQQLTRGLVMLEGTQGSALSLHHGSYPYVTSSDTNASGMAAEAGIAPADVGHVFLVARSYPIRVAGTSGPMAHEVTWDEMAIRAGVTVPERTTVTKNIRRIGEWDDDLYAAAVRLNRPCGVFLTFGDYLDPTIAGTTDWADIEKSGPICTFMDNMLDRAYVPILGVSTGGPDWQVAMRTGRYGKDAECMHGKQWVLA